MRLAQLPRLPSEIWELEDAGYDSLTIRRFNEMHLEFWDWFEAKKAEEHWVPAPKNKKDHVRAPKYPQDQMILDLYYAERTEKDILDPAIASLTDDDMLDLLNDIADMDDGSEPDVTG